MPSSKLQDLLRKHVLREALDPIATVELEKPVAPLDEQRIDGYCELRPERPPDDALPHLGLLRNMAELATCSMVEQFSQPPTRDETVDLLRKKFHLQHMLKKAAKGAAPPELVLWVISPGSPQQVLADCNGVPAALPSGQDSAAGQPGFYFCAPVLTMWVVVLSELPKTPATRMLRMFGPPLMQLAVLAELQTLPADSTEHLAWVDILSEVRYLIESEPNLSREEDAVMTELRMRWEQEKAELRQEGARVGEARGEARGKAEGKAEALIAVMRARGFPVGERTHEQILGCRDLSVLDRWLVRAVTVASETEVLAA